MLFTEVPTEDIVRMQNSLSGAELNSAKVLLADEATKLLHGPQCLESIHGTAKGLFTGTKDGQQQSQGSKTVADDAMMSSLPVYDVKKSDLEQKNNSIWIIELFEKAGLAPSRSAVRRLIANGGVRVNDVKIVNEDEMISLDRFDPSGKLKLSSGKKTHVIVQLVD
jgi:tyrosyl-tRNA synthetase